MLEFIFAVDVTIVVSVMLSTVVVSVSVPNVGLLVGGAEGVLLGVRVGLLVGGGEGVLLGVGVGLLVFVTMQGKEKNVRKSST